MYDVTLNQIRATRPRNNEWKTLVDTFTYSRLAHEYNLPLNPITVLETIGFDSFLRIFSHFKPYRKIFINFACWASLRNISITKQHITAITLYILLSRPLPLSLHFFPFCSHLSSLLFFLSSSLLSCFTSPSFSFIFRNGLFWIMARRC